MESQLPIPLNLGLRAEGYKSSIEVSSLGGELVVSPLCQSARLRHVSTAKTQNQ